MPLNRTPPCISPAPSPAASLLVDSEQAPSSLSSSEPILNFKTDSLASELSPNITFRNAKRKRSEDSGDSKLAVFMADMKQLFHDFQLQQDEKYDKLLSLANSIRDSFDHLAIEHSSLKSHVEQLEVERKENQAYISQLEQKLEKMEQSSRSACIEIRNIPSSKSESKAALLNTVIGVANLLKVNIQQRDVKDLFRIKTKDPTNNPIIVDFTSVLLKEELLIKFRKHNKNSFRITTEHLKLEGPAKTVFVSENLSAKNKRLFFLARDAAKSSNYQYCWVSHGKIFVREKDGKPHLQIKNEADLAHIFISS